jgi:hypothetical protein
MSMKTLLKKKLVVVVAEADEERRQLEAWIAECDDHVFGLRRQSDGSFRFIDLGPRPEACREPINIISRAPDPEIRILSNFAHTPFVLDGANYASVEAFWQGLKHPEASRRAEIAELHGARAKQAGASAPAADEIDYRGQRVRVGTVDHWRLMALACRAKFTQHDAASAALLATGSRPLTQVVRRDSRTIPGVVMGSIWMQIRAEIAK